MGPLQTYFFLALAIGVGSAGWLVIVAVGLRGVVRGLRAGGDRLTFALVGGAMAVVLAFIVLGLLGLVTSLVLSRSGGG